MLKLVPRGSMTFGSVIQAKQDLVHSDSRMFTAQLQSTRSKNDVSSNIAICLPVSDDKNEKL